MHPSAPPFRELINCIRVLLSYWLFIVTTTLGLSYRLIIACSSLTQDYRVLAVLPYTASLELRFRSPRCSHHLLTQRPAKPGFGRWTRRNISLVVSRTPKSEIHMGSRQSDLTTSAANADIPRDEPDRTDCGDIPARETQNNATEAGP